MRKFVTALFLFGFCLPLLARTTVKVVSKVPEGVEIKGEVVKLKPGYVFKRVNQSQFHSFKASSKGGPAAVLDPTGTYSCDCDSGSGACEAIQEHDSLTCQPKKDEKCKGCEMTIVPGKGGIKVRVAPVH